METKTNEQASMPDGPVQPKINWGSKPEPRAPTARPQAGPVGGRSIRSLLGLVKPQVAGIAKTGEILDSQHDVNKDDISVYQESDEFKELVILRDSYRSLVEEVSNLVGSADFIDLVEAVKEGIKKNLDPDPKRAIEKQPYMGIMASYVSTIGVKEIKGVMFSTSERPGLLTMTKEFFDLGLTNDPARTNLDIIAEADRHTKAAYLDMQDIQTPEDEVLRAIVGDLSKKDPKVYYEIVLPLIHTKVKEEYHNNESRMPRWTRIMYREWRKEVKWVVDAFRIANYEALKAATGALIFAGNLDNLKAINKKYRLAYNGYLETLDAKRILDAQVKKLDADKQVAEINKDTAKSNRQLRDSGVLPQPLQQGPGMAPPPPPPPPADDHSDADEDGNDTPDDPAAPGGTP